MPLNKVAVVLDTQARSAVKDARSWVVESLRDLTRDDLAETAELGIAELVTNAILHGEPPVKIRLRGTREHPRVEVQDGSSTPPEPVSNGGDDDLLSTIGRGLGIVATCSQAWGADIVPEGKIVWFEPAPEFQGDPDRAGEVYDATAVDRPEDGELDDGLDVALCRMPAALYGDFRRHYDELRRELRLLALSHESDYPVAKSITELFTRFDDELRMADGVDRMEVASENADHRGRIDLNLRVPASTPSTAAQMIELLELADEFCRAERLLSLASTPQQQEFQRWYLGEFVRQGHGELPRPWTGDDTVRKSAHQSAS